MVVSEGAVASVELIEEQHLLFAYLYSDELYAEHRLYGYDDDRVVIDADVGRRCHLALLIIDAEACFFCLSRLELRLIEDDRLNRLGCGYHTTSVGLDRLVLR